jgi:ABC-type lipoprotein export system ATPase subunit
VDDAALTITETSDTRTQPIRDIRQRIAQGTPGRILLSGPNGSGKTTLLLTLKQELGERAFYLPCQSRLSLATDDSGSTGQQKRSEMDYLHGLADLPQCVFLDEWDANLDPQNLAQVDEVIGALSQRSLVIEVRHHRAASGSAPGQDAAQP